VLKDISFEVEAGEFVAIMGPPVRERLPMLALNGIIPNFFGGKFYGKVSVFGNDTIELSYPAGSKYWHGPTGSEMQL